MASYKKTAHPKKDKRLNVPGVGVFTYFGCSRTWSDSRANCQALGMDLAVLPTPSAFLAFRQAEMAANLGELDRGQGQKIVLLFSCNLSLESGCNMI